MMFPKGKSRIEAILLKMKDAKDQKRTRPDDEMSDDGESSNPGLESAMDEFIAAVKKGDSAGAVSALCSFIHIHEDCEGDASEEESE